MKQVISCYWAIYFNDSLQMIRKINTYTKTYSSQDVSELTVSKNNSPMYYLQLKILIALIFISIFNPLIAQDFPADWLNLPESNEYSPTLSYDGRTMIFESDRSGHWKLYEVKKQAGEKWSKPRYITEINDVIDRRKFIGGSFISYDGNYLFFTTDAKGGQGGMDIWMSERNGSRWSPPAPLEGKINTIHYEGFPSLSPDGKTLYFMRDTKIGDPTDKGRFYVFTAQKNEDGTWDEAGLMDGPINAYPVECPRILPDGQSMVFASKRPDSVGGFDLYIIRKNENQSWDLPQSMNQLNSLADENCFTTDAEGSRYFFTRSAMTQDDIYFAEMTREEEQLATIRLLGRVYNAATSELLPATVTLSNKDNQKNLQVLQVSNGTFKTYLERGIDISMEASCTGFLANSIDINLKSPELNLDDSTRQRMSLSELMEEIALDEKDAEKMEKYLRLNQESNEKMLKEYTNTLFLNDVKEKGTKGKNLKEREALKKEVELVKEENIKLKEDAELLHLEAVTGMYEILYRNLDNYRVEGVENISQPALFQEQEAQNDWKAGQVYRDKQYASSSTKRFEEFRTTAYNYEESALRKIYLAYEYYFQYLNFNKNEISRDIYLTPLKVDVVVVLQNINFDLNKYELREDAMTELNQVLELLYENPDIRLEISAHTDDIGSEDYNSKLSQQRADAVVAYLVSKNIDQNRLEGKGYGFRKPLVPNDSEYNRFLNRRVEFKVIE
ncbi:MAG: OmpA family protein [Bacteroidales bacterium]|nr:OmpA family protein [Bacteroidales bacterium]